MKSKTMPTGNIMQMLSLVAAGRLPAFEIKLSKIGPGEVKRGTVKSASVRRLYKAMEAIAMEAKVLAKAHDELHREDDHDRGECRKFGYRLAELEKRHNVLFGLTWQAVSEEHPNAAEVERLGIRTNWALVTRNDEWPEMNPSAESAESVIIPRILDVFRNASQPAPAVDLDPINDDPVIGEVTDNRLKHLFALNQEILQQASKQFPPEAEAEFQQWFECQTVKNVAAVHRKIMQAIRFSELIGQLFWRGVRDLDPSIDAPLIAVRSGWKIVKLPGLQEKPESFLSTLLGGNGSIVVHLYEG